MTNLNQKVTEWLNSLGVDVSDTEVDLEVHTQRLPAIGKNCGNKSAVLFVDEDRVTYFDHVSNQTATLRFDSIGEYAPLQVKVQSKEEQTKQANDVAQKSLDFWNKATKPSQTTFAHYLSVKGIDQTSCYNIRIGDKNDVIVPLFTLDGELRNLQRIFLNPNKADRERYPKRPVFKGGDWEGLVHFHSEPRVTSAFLVTEGWSTGYSAQDILKNYNLDVCVVSAMSSGQLKNATLSLRSKYPNALIVLGLDNDRNKERASEVAVKDIIGLFPVIMPKQDGHDFDDMRRETDGNAKYEEFIKPMMDLIENHKPVAKLRFVEAPVGGGKTYTFVHKILKGRSNSDIFLYVAPTLDLLEQTTKQVRAAIPDLPLSKIVSDDESIGSVQERLIEELNRTVEEGESKLILITHITFLNVVGKLQPSIKKRLRVYADEAFTAVTFFTLNFGKGATNILNNFETFDRYVELSIDGKVTLKPTVKLPLNKKVQGDIINIFSHEAQRILPTPGYICEGFPSERLSVYLKNKGIWPHNLNKSDFSDGYDNADDERLDMVVGCYVDPKMFKGFKTFTLMSAVFTEHLLAALWKSLNVQLAPDQDFVGLRDTHAQHGHRMKFYYMSERASMSFLDQSYQETIREFGDVFDKDDDTKLVKHCMELIEKEMPSKYLLQVNNKYYDEHHKYIDTLSKGIRIPFDVAGMNNYRHIDNIAILGVVNPNPQQGDWWVKRTGLDIGHIRQLTRIMSIYQAMGRISIRVEGATNPVTVVVLGKNDAEWLHKQFPNSELCGFWPGSEELSIKVKNEPYKDAEYKKHAKQIEAFLDTNHSNDNTVKSSVVLEGTGLTKLQHSRASSRVRGWHKKGHYYYRNEKI